MSGEEEGQTSGQNPRGRVDAIDVARGVALIGMAAFHLSWDLADFGLVSPLLPFTPPMRLLSHTVASAFLALAGVSLALAHRDRLNLTAFGKRLALVAGAAALVTVGSSLLRARADDLVRHPSLHRRGEPAGAAFDRSACLAEPGRRQRRRSPCRSSFQSKAFDAPALLWLGLGEALPNTLDWRPLLPWARRHAAWPRGHPTAGRAAPG